MSDFIQRSYLNKQNSLISNFDEIIKNKISIILGEPASGKTYQFKYYKNKYSESTIKIDLINLYDFDLNDITSDIKVVLFDSLDEALEEKQFKKFAIAIKKVIQDIIKINSNINIVISCRYLDWKEYFKKEIYKNEQDIKIYYIEDLKENDIEKILIDNKINKKEFWDWVSINHLKEIISKNILVFSNILKNFDEYKKENMYIDIYERIILNYIVAKGDDREYKENLTNISSDEKMQILSIVAIYMSLNLKSKLNIDVIPTLDRELYNLKDLNITHSKLELLFSTSLFKVLNDDIYFSHKTFREFLSAYFLYIKKIDFETLKNIFGHKYGFYDEFEEIVVYLVELNDSIYNSIVRFDPFVFRRYSKFDSDKQEILVKSIINYTQDNYLKTKVKNLYLKNSELNKIELLNIVDILKSNIKLKDITNETYQYIIGIFNYKYSEELEKFIIDIWNKNLNANNNNDRLIELFNSDDFGNLNDTFENIKYCNILLDYILKNNLINHDIDILRYRLFMTLYNKVEFDKLIYNLNSKIGFHALSLYHNMIIKLSSADLNRLFKNISSQKEVKLDNNQLTILVLNILKNYKFLHNDIKLDELNNLISKTNMNYEFIGTKNEFDYYKDTSFESLAVENKTTIQVPFSIVKFICQIPQYGDTEKTTDKTNNNLNFKEVSNRLMYWIENQSLDLSEEFYPIMRDKIKNFDLSELVNFNMYLKSFHDKNSEFLQNNIKTVIFQFLVLEKGNYNYIKKYWLQDICKNYFYFKYMIMINSNEAINDFRKEIFDKSNIQIRVDNFEKNIDYDKSIIDIDKINKVKYLLTSINYIYKPKKQHNFLLNVKEISDENLKFIIEQYYSFFNEYKYPKKEIKLDEYLEMNQAISQIFNNLALDTQRISFLESVLNTNKNQSLQKNIKNTLEKLYILRIKNRDFTNKYYKGIFDNYKQNEQRDFISDLYSASCKILDSRQTMIMKENPISLQFKNLLNSNGYRVHEQGTGGESQSGKDLGERDLQIENEKGDIISLVEAIRVKSFEEKNIKVHYSKLLEKYDVLGNKENYMFVYYFGNNIEDIWEKYIINFDNFQEIKNEEYTKEEIKIGMNYTKKGSIVYHFVLKFKLGEN